MKKSKQYRSSMRTFLDLLPDLPTAFVDAGLSKTSQDRYAGYVDHMKSQCLHDAAAGTLPLFDVQEAEEYLARFADIETPWTNYPPMMAPFPAQLLFSQRSAARHHFFPKWNAAVVFSLTAEQANNIVANAGERNNSFMGAALISAIEAAKESTVEAKWRIVMLGMNTGGSPDNVLVMPGSIGMSLNEYGRLIVPPMVSMWGVEGHEGSENICNIFMTQMLPFLYGLGLLNTHGRRLVTVKPSSNASRVHRQRHGRPLVVYRRITIDVDVDRREDRSNQNGPKKQPLRWHQVRGVWVHYGQDGRGLYFGKMVKSVWRPLHERGDAKVGKVIKDYKLRGVESRLTDAGLDGAA